MDREIPLQKVLFLSIGYLKCIFCDIFFTGIIATSTAVIQQIFVRSLLCSGWAPYLGQKDVPIAWTLPSVGGAQEQTE